MKSFGCFTAKPSGEEFSEINDKHRKAWVKTILYNSIFLSDCRYYFIAYFGVVVLYGGIKFCTATILRPSGICFSYTMFIGMLFNPLRQIADKFNEMQMGMISANRVFDIIDTQDQIQDTGSVTASF
ncbi:MAG: hypothetical protein U0X58_08575 [Flavobacteriaceae bacterium]